ASVARARRSPVPVAHARATVWSLLVMLADITDPRDPRGPASARGSAGRGGRDAGPRGQLPGAGVSRGPPGPQFLSCWAPVGIWVQSRPDTFHCQNVHKSHRRRGGRLVRLAGG